jgi:hypothetical protein
MEDRIDNKHILKAKERLGKIFISTQGLYMKIINYVDSMNCSVQFEDGTVVNNLQFNQIKVGYVKNPFFASTYGEGYIGVGDNITHIKGKKVKAYAKWIGMLERCYSEKYHVKNPIYKECCVSDEWKNFQIFADWFYKNYDSDIMKDWQLDKDILVKGNKIYSPETCCFVPREINMLFVSQNKQRGDCPIGVSKRGNSYRVYCRTNGKNKLIGSFKTSEEAYKAYKIKKEEYIKEIADKWKDLIHPKVYQALYNYKVGITN